MARLRSAQTDNERNAAMVENRPRVQAAKARDRTKVTEKEALLSREILEGTHKVKELKDTDDNIGKMEHVCEHCNALKFKKETGSTCCGSGKVRLTAFPTPPVEINRLWHAATAEG